jgi:hypothetical protein
MKFTKLQIKQIIKEKIISELFDKPYQVNKEGYFSDEAVYSFYSDSVRTGEKQKYIVTFYIPNVSYPSDPPNMWGLEFHIDKKDNNPDTVYSATGDGNSIRVFASVLEAIKMFIQDYEPNAFKFYADYEEGDKPGKGRVDLYKSMVSRYAAKAGYFFEWRNTSMGDKKAVKFILIKQ